MSKSDNMLSSVMPWDTVAQGYSETTMLAFQAYASEALGIAQVSRDSAILDVACGPGTLSLLAAPNVKSIDAIDFSQQMINLLKALAKEKAHNNITPCHGDGQNLPYTNNTFDNAFSMFGLMFSPTAQKAIRKYCAP